MADCTINGIRYQTGRLSPRQQWNITRRVSPIIADVLPSLRLFMATAPGTDDDAKLVTVLQPFMDAIGKLTDADSDYIIDTCLKAASRARNDSGWTRCMTPDGQFLFDDMDMRTMLELTVRTVMENIGDFTSALPGLSRAPQEVQKSN